MPISRDIYKLWKKLRADPEEGDLFSSNAQELLGSTSEGNSILERLSAREIDAAQATILTLRALEIQQQDIEERWAKSELTVTFPGETTTNARPNHQVIREMLRGARDEIILVGYRVNSEDVLDQLHEAAKRKVTLCLICSRREGDAKALLSDWPAGVPSPTVYEDKEQAETSLMHIKCLLVDRQNLLVTSANFTFSGMKKNFELGIHTEGSAAHEAHKVLHDLIASGAFQEVTE